MSELFIHVGLHKTGTSFIQQEIYSNMVDLNYTRRNIFLMKQTGDNKYLISNEGLSACPFESKMNNRMTYKDRFVIADRLKSCFPDAKIIICIRKDRVAWSKSLYSEYVKSCNILSYNKFMSKYNISSFYDFDEYISYLKSNFKDVFVCEFELLKSNLDLFVNDLCSFIGVRVPVFKNIVINKKLSDGDILRRKLYNLFDGGIKKLL